MKTKRIWEPRPLNLTPGCVSVVKTLVDKEISKIEKQPGNEINTQLLGRLIRTREEISNYEEREGIS